MFRKIILLSCCLMVCMYLKGYSQQYKWGKMFDGEQVSVNDIAIDNSGNKYIVGSMGSPNVVGTVDSADLDPGPGTYMINTDNGLFFYAKYDPSGNFVWGKQLEGNLSKIRVTSSGNLLIAALIIDPNQLGLGTAFDFDPGPGTAMLTTYGNDQVLATYSSTDGSFIAAKQIQTFEYQSNFGYALLGARNSLDVDYQGNIYLCGSFGGAVDFDLDGTINNAYNFGTGTGYFLKYNSNFDLITGYLIPNTGLTTLQHDPTLEHIYVLDGSSIYKFDSSANLIWKDTIEISSGTILQGSINDLNIDAGENIYIHGSLPLNGSITFQPGPGAVLLEGPSFSSSSNQSTNGFLAKYKSNGQLTWAKKVAGAGRGYINHLKIDDDNKLVCEVAIAPANTSYPYPAGPLDIANNTVDTAGNFIAIYDTAANLLQYKNIRGTVNEVFYNEMKLQNKDIYLCGSFRDSTDFDPLTPLGLLAQENYTSGSLAGYLVKYNQCLDNFTSVSASICPGTIYQFGTQALTAPGNYFNVFAIGNECDSMVALNLTQVAVDTIVTKSNNTLTANANSATYQWLNCSNNTAIQGATGKTFTPSASGNYKVVVTQNGCSDTSNCYNVNITGINQPEFAKYVQLFPNPVNSKLNINYSPTLPLEQVSIADITGRTVQHVITIKDRTGHMSIDIQQLHAGVYFLKLMANGEQAVFKFVKQ